MVLAKSPITVIGERGSSLNTRVTWSRSSNSKVASRSITDFSEEQNFIVKFKSPIFTRFSIILNKVFTVCLSFVFLYVDSSVLNCF